MAGQTLTLKMMVGGQEKESRTAVTDDAGRFRFEGLPTGSNYTYELSLVYQGADYTWEGITFAAGETAKSVETVVYDSTSSPETIKVEVAHVVIEPQDKEIAVTEILLFVNEGQKTYIGSETVAPDGKKATLRFSLPSGATKVTPRQGLMECCLVQNGKGFVDTMSLKPGPKEVVFSYQVAYSDSALLFAKAVDYPTTALNVLIKDMGLQVQSDSLAKAGPVTIQGKSYLLFPGKNLTPGANWVLRLSGLPQGSFQDNFRWLAIALPVIVLGIGLTYPLFRSRMARKPTPSPQSGAETERRRLLQEIAQLDDDFEAGKLSTADYREKRAEKMAHLILLSRGRGSS